MTLVIFASAIVGLRERPYRCFVGKLPIELDPHRAIRCYGGLEDTGQPRKFGSKPPRPACRSRRDAGKEMTVALLQVRARLQGHATDVL